MSTNDKVYVAKLGKAVGLKGQLRLFIDSDFPDQFKKNAVFTTNRKLSLKIEHYEPSRDLVKFEGYDDMLSAKKLTNQELYVSQEQTKENCQLKENEYFWFDLIGCSIIEKGTVLGVVKEVHRFPLNDYFEVTTDALLVEKALPKTFLIPYIVDNFIVDVDITTKTIQTNNCFDILENS